MMLRVMSVACFDNFSLIARGQNLQLVYSKGKGIKLSVIEEARKWAAIAAAIAKANTQRVFIAPMSC